MPTTIDVKDAAGTTRNVSTLDALLARLPADPASNAVLEVIEGAPILSPTAMPAGGSGLFGWLSAIWTAINTGVAVTGTFYPATQPVSGTVALGAGSAAIGKVSLTDISEGEYETVAASQTAQVLGATGGTGDYISGLLVIPATTSPGVVTLLDNATSIPVFVGGASSVGNLVPFFIPLGIKSVSGAWKVTTGANVSVIGIGNFA